MIQIKRISEALLGVVGWQQGYTTEDQISEVLTRSESGLYFQNVHPLLTMQNIRSIAPQFTSEAPAYESDKKYEAKAMVKYRGKMYRAVKTSIGKTPDSNTPAYWVNVDLFSEWLSDKTKGSIMSMVNTLCTEKTLNGTMKTLCENKILYDGTGRMYDTIANKDNLVGLEVIPIRSMGVTVKIEKIGLQFTKPGKYKIYIMQSGSNAPYKEIEVIKTEANSMEWFPLVDCYLPYMDNDIEAGGSWYICYSQNELPEGSEAINKDYDWSNPPCRSCSRYNYQLWNYWSRYMKVQPFLVNNENLNGIGFNEDFNEDYASPKMAMWDIQNNIYGNNTNYGINLQVSIGCDITDFIIEQRLGLANLIGLQIGVDFLREMAYNSNARYNTNTFNIANANEIRYELDGDSGSMKKSGLVYKLEQAYKAISIETSGISKVCMPCNHRGVRYGIVG